VNIGSIAGLAPWKQQWPTPSQAGVIHLTRCLASPVARGGRERGRSRHDDGDANDREAGPELVSGHQAAALQKPVERDDVARQIVEFCRATAPPARCWS